jgi:hypothetical protein
MGEKGVKSYSTNKCGLKRRQKAEGSYAEGRRQKDELYFPLLNSF